MSAFKSKRPVPEFNVLVQERVDLQDIDYTLLYDVIQDLTERQIRIDEAMMEVAYYPDGSFELWVTGFREMTPAEKTKEKKRLAAIEAKNTKERGLELAELRRLMKKYPEAVH